jgi:hypothetical protein
VLGWTDDERGDLRGLDELERVVERRRQSEIRRADPRLQTGSTSAGSTSENSTSEGSTSGDSTSTAAETTTAGSTTEPAACAGIVGSRECALLAEVSPELDLAACLLCQGAACGAEARCDAQYPCVDDKIVIQGCCTDEECEGLTPFCGMYTGTNNVCVLHDDV